MQSIFGGVRKRLADNIGLIQQLAKTADVFAGLDIDLFLQRDADFFRQLPVFGDGEAQLCSVLLQRRNECLRSGRGVAIEFVLFAEFAEERDFPDIVNQSEQVSLEPLHAPRVTHNFAGDRCVEGVLP